MQIVPSALPAVPVLLCSSGGRLCALPLSHVGETLRPLPVTPLPGVDACVLGAATLRGQAVPVVALSALLGAPAGAPARFVSLRLGSRTAALAVDEVIGVRAMPAALLDETPPLLDGGADAQLAGIGARDAELLLVLRAARSVPESVWQALDAPAEVK
ncbi:MAG TPA: chemotaxis protein CheW [Pseudoduganella sp.]